MLLLFSLTAAADQCREGVTWPGDSWPAATPTPQQAAILDQLVAYAFSEDPPAEDGAVMRTNSVVIIHRGEVLLERYARGFDASMRHVGWSVTKSALSMMVGVAEHAGELALSDRICDHIEIPRQDNCGITVENMLTFSTGLRWAETYEDKPPTASSVANMLFGEGRADAAAFVAGHEAIAPPGTLYDYSSGDSVLLAATLSGAVTDRFGPDFLWSQLFEPIGMTSAQVSRDQAGTLLGSSGLHATPLDYARLGYLALQEGCWDGVPLVAADWMARSTTVSPVFLANTENWSGGSRPGLSWWLNAAEPTGEVPWAGVPPTAFAALGHQGQAVYVLPSHDLVVVRTAADSGDALDRGRFLTLAMAAAEAAPPPPPPPQEPPPEAPAPEESP
jgi:CubicO group peptidase (beta-lactamase class C family)